MVPFSQRRRKLLKALVSSSASLPFLQALPSLGADETPRKRLILMFSPNGTIPEEFFPSGGERDFTLKKILSPLQSIRNDLLIFKGLDIKIGEPGDAHQRGMGGLWTASHLTEGSTKGGGTNSIPVDWASGPSVDQVVAPVASAGLPYESLEYGIQCGGPNIWTRMCYNGRNNPIEPEQNPYNAFNRLYKDFDNEGSLDSGQQRSVRLASVLDGVLQDFSRMRSQLSSEDKEKLEIHEESVRQIERSLDAPEPGTACELPNQGNSIDINAAQNYPQLGKLFMDMMVSAFSCNQTAVASMQWTRSVGQLDMSSFIDLDTSGGIDVRHHDMSHAADDNTQKKNNLIKINTWYAEQLLYLVQQLKDTPDPSGSGSLFDNTLVVWGNELGKGNSHTRDDIPFVMAGSAQGQFNTGRYLQYNRASHSSLLTSLCHAFGVESNGFGDYSDEPLNLG